MVVSLTRTTWVADAFNQFLNLNGRFFSCVGHNEGYRKVNDSTNCTDRQGRNAQYPVFWGVCQVVGTRNEQPALVHKDVRQGEAQTGQHTGDCTDIVNPLGENTHHQCREQGRCCDAEG